MLRVCVPVKDDTFFADLFRALEQTNCSTVAYARILRIIKGPLSLTLPLKDTFCVSKTVLFKTVPFFINAI